MADTQVGWPSGHMEDFPVFCCLGRLKGSKNRKGSAGGFLPFSFPSRRVGRRAGMLTNRRAERHAHQLTHSVIRSALQKRAGIMSKKPGCESRKGLRKLTDIMPSDNSVNHRSACKPQTPKPHNPILKPGAQVLERRYGCTPTNPTTLTPVGEAQVRLGSRKPQTLSGKPNNHSDGCECWS